MMLGCTTLSPPPPTARGVHRWADRRDVFRRHVSAFSRKHGVVFASKDADSIDVNDLPLPEGTMGFPILGEQFEFGRDRDFSVKRVAKYGPIFKTRLLATNTVFLCGLENIQEAESNFSDSLPPWESKTMEQVLGEKSISRLRGDEHKFVRKSFYPAFSTSAVDGYVPSIVNRATKFLEDWAGQPSVNFHEQTREFAFDITTKGIVGVSYGNHTKEEVLNAFKTWWAGFASIPINLPFTKFGRTLAARRMLCGLIQENIEKARRGDMRGGKALSILLAAENEAGQSMNDKQLQDAIFTILAGGYDTTSCAMVLVLLELARHPEVLEKVRSEQREVMSKLGSEITGQSLRAMPYLDAVIKEAMRVTPVIGGVVRRAVNTIGFKGFRIPKGWNVIYAYGATMQTLDDRWPGDTEFNPERFLTEEGKRPGSYVPFGFGAHTCIGNIVVTAEMKSLFALIARDYDFEVEKLYPEMNYTVIPDPVGGLYATFRKRDRVSLEEEEFVALSV